VPAQQAGGNLDLSKAETIRYHYPVAFRDTSLLLWSESTQIYL